MRAIVLLSAVLLNFMVSASAADDVAAAQNVIRSQEQAFSRDDAAAAYRGVANNAYFHYLRTGAPI